MSPRLGRGQTGKSREIAGNYCASASTNAVESGCLRECLAQTANGQLGKPEPISTGTGSLPWRRLSIRLTAIPRGAPPGRPAGWSFLTPGYPALFPGNHFRYAQKTIKQPGEARNAVLRGRRQSVHFPEHEYGVVARAVEPRQITHVEPFHRERGRPCQDKRPKVGLRPDAERISCLADKAAFYK